MLKIIILLEISLVVLFLIYHVTTKNISIHIRQSCIMEKRVWKDYLINKDCN